MISLARKYRPKRFADLIAQDHVAQALRGAVARGRVGHGYLLTGSRGVGKTTAARILAMALNCSRRDAKNPTGEPCGECENCLRIWNGSANLDVVEIDAASNRSVDDARDLRERAMYAASQQDGYKVYIVDEAHMLTREAWNALLKILEEPPPRVVFVFATTEPQKIANTAAPVLSRLQRFDFKRIAPAAIRKRLTEVLDAEGLGAEDDALALIARYADGGMRDALSVLDQCLSLAEGKLTQERVRQALGLIDDESYAATLQLIAARDTAGVFPLVERLVASGADLVEFMMGMADVLRSVLMLQTGAVPEDITSTVREAAESVKDVLQPGDVLRMLGLLTQAETAIRRSANTRLAIETLVLRWTMLDRIVDLEQVLRGEGRGGNEEPSPRSEARAARAPGPPAAGPPPRQSGPPPSPPPNDEPPARPAPSRPAVARTGPLGLDAIRGGWPNVVLRGREKSSLLGMILDALDPIGLEAGKVSVNLRTGDDHMIEGLKRQGAAVEDVLTAEFGTKLVLVLADEAGKPTQTERPKRLSGDELRAERLRDLRGQDRALDKAADALDLEIVE